jgi:hypothetical protein
MLSLIIAPPNAPPTPSNSTVCFTVKPIRASVPPPCGILEIGVLAKGLTWKNPASSCSSSRRNALVGKLRWYDQELPFDCNLRVEDKRPDGTCVVYGSRVSLEYKPYPEVGHIFHVEESLDQGTVDRMERAEQFGFLHGVDFILFEDSPESEKRYRDRTL